MNSDLTLNSARWLLYNLVHGVERMQTLTSLASFYGARSDHLAAAYGFTEQLELRALGQLLQSCYSSVDSWTIATTFRVCKCALFCLLYVIFYLMRYVMTKFQVPR